MIIFLFYLELLAFVKVPVLCTTRPVSLYAELHVSNSKNGYVLNYFSVLSPRNM